MPDYRSKKNCAVIACCISVSLMLLSGCEAATEFFGFLGLDEAFGLSRDFAIVFDRNDTDATGFMDTQIISSGTSANLILCTFAKVDWSFVGWSTSPDGAVEYLDQAAITMGYEDIVLYAIWEFDGYWIVFDRNDDAATGTMGDQILEEGATANLSDCGYGKVGWLFSGWSLSPNGPVQFANQSVFTMGTTGVILCAIWTQQDFAVVYDKNDPLATGRVCHRKRYRL